MGTGHDDARGVAKRLRHGAIFGAIESLERGETMRFVNDHDPLPLLHQIALRYGDRVRVEYVERRPGQVVLDFAIALPGEAVTQRAAQDPGCGGGAGCGCGG